MPLLPVTCGGVNLKPETNLLFPFPAPLLHGGCIKVILASQKAAAKELFFLIFSKNVYKIGIIHSMNVWKECSSAATMARCCHCSGLVKFSTS